MLPWQKPDWKEPIIPKTEGYYAPTGRITIIDETGDKSLITTWEPIGTVPVFCDSIRYFGENEPTIPLNPESEWLEMPNEDCGFDPFHDKEN